MRRFILTLATLLVLPACDSGGSTDSNDLVGTWRTQSLTTSLHVTSSVAQTARDPVAAGTGSVAVSGAVVGTLRFAPIRSAGAAITGGFLGEIANLDPLGGQTLIRFAADGTPSVTRDGQSFALVPVVGQPPYTFSATAIAFSGATFRQGAAGPTVTATGRLEFVPRPLAAGQESLAALQASAPADFGIASITFDADGAYRSLGSSGSQTGTWVATGDGQVTLATATSSEAFRYEIRGSQLTLTLSGSNAGAADLLSFEPLLGVTAGSLTALRSTNTIVFGRAAE